MCKPVLRKFVWSKLAGIIFGACMLVFAADMYYTFFELPKLTKDDFEIIGITDEFYYDDYAYDSKNHEYMVFFDEISKESIRVSLTGDCTQEDGGFYDVIFEGGDGSENRVEIWSASKKHLFSEYKTSVAVIYTNDESIYDYIEMEK